MITFLEECCDKEWMEIIDFHKIEFNFKKGDTFIHSGQEVKGLYFIQDGKAKVMLDLQQDETRIIRLASDGDILGHRGLGLEKKYPISVEALTDISLWYIPLPVFETILKTNSKFAYKMMMFFADELKSTEETMVDLDVEGRLARTIWKNYKAFGGNNEDNMLLGFTLSRNDLANMTNTTYATTIRTLKKLEQKKIIELLGKEIKILELKELKKLFKKAY